ncbi:hypothetical protein ACKLNO_10730 [Neisseriaceae bacterium B1]
MPKHIPKQNRQPRYKKANCAQLDTSVAWVELRSQKPRRVQPLPNGGRRYLISPAGAMMMPMAMLAASGIFAAAFYIAITLSGLNHWFAWIIFSLFWLWLTESWWFGLTTRIFADVYREKIVIYGAFGRKKQTLLRSQCQFYYRQSHRDTTPALWVKRANRRVPLRVDNTLCANWEDFLCEVGAREMLGNWLRS